MSFIFIFYETKEYISHTGRWANLFDEPIPHGGSLEEVQQRASEITLDDVTDWVEKYEGMEGRFRFYDCYMNLSSLYFTVAKPLLSIRTTGSMDVERVAKPLKDVILTKKRNSLSDERVVSLLRAQQNLKYLMSARETLKGKVFDSLVTRDPAHCVDLMSKHHQL